MPPPYSGGPVDSAETGIEASHIQGGKAKGKGKGKSFAAVASKAVLKPIEMEPPCRQAKIIVTFKLAQTNGKLAKPPPLPTRPSLVLSLMHHMLFLALKTKVATVLAPVLVKVCNNMLALDPTHANIWVSAAKWTPKGNLVVFAGPDITYDALFATLYLCWMT